MERERSQKEDEDMYAETETARKLKKMKLFAGQCSKVLDHLFVGGDKVAQDRQLLLDHSVGRILNCAGTVLPCHHKGDATLRYYTLPLLDARTEEINRFFYDIISLIDSGQREGQSLFVHCHQGVSRSCTLVIAYLMWKQSLNYDQAFHALREARGVCQPNVGFMCQLIEWDKHRKAALDGTLTKPTIYMSCPSEMDDHCSFPGAPWVVKPDSAQLQSRLLLADDHCVVVQTPQEVLLWKGTQCSDVVFEGAKRHTDHLHAFEGAPSPREVERTTEDFQSALIACGFGADGQSAWG